MIKDIPRPEYPRPQFVREDWINLNGEWLFRFDHHGEGERGGFPKDERHFDKKILVPFCFESELSGLGDKDFCNHVWYRKEFEIPKRWKGKRIFVNFGAVDYEATVWLNGVKIGTHRGGSAPFSCELTEHLVNGKNVLVLRATDLARINQPRGKQSDRYQSYACSYTRVTGIWQTVWLEAVEYAFIRSVKMIPHIDNGRLTVYADIDGNFSGLTLKAEAYASGRKVGSAKVKACKTTALTLDLTETILWDMENPFLYDIVFELETADSVLDKVQSYFGLRKVEIEGKKILLNGKSIFMRMVLDQGYYPDGIWTAPSDAALKKDIEISLSLGFNGARLHQKVFEERFLYWCDKMGYIVWGEYPNWGLDPNNPQTMDLMVPEWVDIINRDFNHPSIIGWCPFNEIPDGEQSFRAQEAIYRLTKAIDSTRLAIDVSGYIHCGVTDVYDCHNYQQDPKILERDFSALKEKDEAWHINNPAKDMPYRGQPFFNSEFGGTFWATTKEQKNAWGYGNKPKSKTEFYQRYHGLATVMLQHPHMCGFCYTQLYDVEQEWNGMYTYYRKPKFDPKVIKKINQQKAKIEE